MILDTGAILVLNISDMGKMACASRLGFVRFSRKIRSLIFLDANQQ